ncbi:hypothetical protein JKP88DRAFT_253942 [Tribonema minus]|uniref:EF-hand domain-containing protein n=1 Tax=Tribonema minus TaxID=303371 RepID=A0A835Z644_9STRA|nr:hypothetical protein JKP88DRAFT_253942 [Tribonema minus]
MADGLPDGEYGRKPEHHNSGAHHDSEKQLPPLQRALKKLQRASLAYDPGRDGVFREGFAGSRLRRAELRSMLWRLFCVKLSADELDAVFTFFSAKGELRRAGGSSAAVLPHKNGPLALAPPPELSATPLQLSAAAVAAHDNDSDEAALDGSVFLLHFLQLGHAERERKNREQLHRDRACRDALEAQRIHAPRAITSRCSCESGCSPSLRLIALQIRALVMLREQLHRDRARRDELEAQRAREEERAAAEAERGLRVPYAPEDMDSALAKLMEAAVRYDKSHPAAVGLDAFEGAKMTAPVFCEQLRRTFRIRLTPPELAALMQHFDKAGDGTVDTATFLLTFFKTGFRERARRLQEKRAAEQRQREAADAERTAWLEAQARRNELKAQARRNELKAWMDARWFAYRYARWYLIYALNLPLCALIRHVRAPSLLVDFTFTDADVASGLAKLRAVAAMYDPSSPSALSLEGFGGESMQPHVFKDQLTRVFRLRPSPRELGALMRHFNVSGDGTVNCVEFTKTFFRLGFDERAKRRKAAIEEQRVREAQALEEEEKAQEEARARAELQVDYDFTEQDSESAMAKLRRAAERYDRNHPSSMSLAAFEGAKMAPHVFKEQLKRVFNIVLTRPELGALMRHFDKDGDGSVDCAEFLLSFFKTGFAARNAALERRRRAARARQDEARTREERERAEYEARSAAAVASFTERDLEEALDLILKAASRYDRQALGPGGLEGWCLYRMTPYQLKDQLHRSFQIRPTPPQLGAIMAMFDLDRSGTVEIPEFLNAFFKIGMTAKAMLGHKDTPQRLRQYRDTLKQALAADVQLEVARPAVPESAGSAKGPHQRSQQRRRLKLASSQGARDGDGDDKGDKRVKRRVASARATLRLDLSTWHDRRDGDAVLYAVPAAALSITALAELWLTNNDIPALPPEIGALTSLHTLGVGGNCLTSVPPEVGRLTALRRLHCEGNWLRDLPPELALCTGLRELRLDCNQFTAVPPCLLRLRGLEALSLSRNLIGRLPANPGGLRSLLELDLDGNPLGGPAVPPPIFALINLVALGLANTGVAEAEGRAVIAAALSLDSLRIGGASPVAAAAARVAGAAIQSAGLCVPPAPAPLLRPLSCAGAPHAYSGVPLQEYRALVRVRTARRHAPPRQSRSAGTGG